MKKGIKPLTCIACGAAYRTWRGFIRHQEIHRTPEEGLFKMKTVGYGFKTKDESIEKALSSYYAAGSFCKTKKEVKDDTGAKALSLKHTKKLGLFSTTM